MARSTDLSTAFAQACRREMRVLMLERKPWERHSRAAIREAFLRCREDAAHNAAVSLRLDERDLCVLGSQFEVDDIGGAEATAPHDADGFEQVGEELPVFAGDAGSGDV